MSIYSDMLKTTYVYELYVFTYEFEYAYRCAIVQKYTEHGEWERARPRTNIIGKEEREEFSGKTKA